MEFSETWPRGRVNRRFLCFPKMDGGHVIAPRMSERITDYNLQLTAWVILLGLGSYTCEML